MVMKEVMFMETVYINVCFDTDKPNAETLAAMDDVENRRNLSRPFHDTHSLMEALDKDD